jgi:predicted SAM-dependent methyltransferase
MNSSLLTRIRRYRWYLLGRLKIKKQIKKQSLKGKLKIVLGAHTDIYEGWISTDLPHFNILKQDDWEYFFNGLKIDNLLIEHVLEHFTKDEVEYVLTQVNKYLKSGGNLRIAVPDGYHPDTDYKKLIIPPADGHQSVWNIDSLQKLLSAKGFNTDALEFYSEKGIFSGRVFDFTNGTITRSRHKGFKSESHPDYSSLIVDAYKK